MHIEELVKNMLLKKLNKNEKHEIVCCLLYNINSTPYKFHVTPN